MKKFIIALCVMLSMGTMAFAEVVEGTFAPLTHNERVRFSVDFSQALIHGMYEEDFEEYERDWAKDKAGIESKIFSEAMDKLGNLLILGHNIDTPYKIVVVVRRVNVDGDFVSDVIAMENDEVFGVIKNISGRGGTIGSKLNLIKDGAESTGENVGALLRREIKRAIRRAK